LIDFGGSDAKIPVFREWMGDEPVRVILLGNERDRRAAEKLFPEAQIVSY